MRASSDKSFSSCIVILLLVLSVASPTAIAQQQWRGRGAQAWSPSFGQPKRNNVAPASIDVGKKASSSVKLKASAVHSERLPALPAHYRAGATFNDGRFRSRRRQTTPLKFKIPIWLAGTWRRTQSTEKSRIELPSGKKLKTTGKTVAGSTDRFGTYKDRQGQIWQVFYPAHSSGEVDRGQFIDRHTVTKYDLEIIGSKSVVVEIQAYHLVVSKDGRRIMQSYQDEELNTYSLVNDGVVNTDSSVKVFDCNGKPKLLTRSISQIRRIKPFSH